MEVNFTVALVRQTPTSNRGKNPIISSELTRIRLLPQIRIPIEVSKVGPSTSQPKLEMSFSEVSEAGGSNQEESAMNICLSKVWSS